MDLRERLQAGRVGERLQAGRVGGRLEAERLRADFPTLRREVGGRPLVYLDSAATTQKPQAVIDAVREFYEQHNAAVHRSVHTLGEEATAAYEAAREKVARFVGADPRGVVFTRGTTESTNLVAYAWVRRRLGPGDEIVLTEMEHHSNLVPWQLAARDCGARLRFVGVTDDGDLDYGALESVVGERTRFVSVTGMSNVLGTMTDMAPVVAAAKAVGAVVLVDGAQLVPHAPVDFSSLGCDFLAFSGHKMCGPTGVGALVARPELLEEMEPFLGGGEMIRDVWLEGATWNDVPYKFEAGTMMVAEAVGLGAAVDYLSAVGMDAIREHERELAAYGLAALEAVEDLVIYGPREAERRGAIFSFNLGDRAGGIIHPHDVGTMLDAEGIAIRAGHHCAKPLMRRLDVPATCRASLYLYNTPEEIDRLVEALEKARAFFVGS